MYILAFLCVRNVTEKAAVQLRGGCGIDVEWWNLCTENFIFCVAFVMFITFFNFFEHISIHFQTFLNIL